MRRAKNIQVIVLMGCGLVAGVSLPAQVPNPTQPAPNRQGANRQGNEPAPIFRVEVVARTAQAVNYLHRGGSTKVDFQGTPLAPSGKGSATVESQRGVIRVAADFKNFPQPSSFGPEYLTYVLWAISPDGRPVNLGELTLDHYGEGSSSKIEATSDIQTFGMIVTAEPYYAVTQPSDVVVMENAVRPDTRGVIESINARYELLPRGVYTSHGRIPGFVPVMVGKKNPFELYEAENAVQLARVAGAENYAAESFVKAASALRQAEQYQLQHPGQKPVITMAREAVVRAEDARVVALRRQRDEQDASRLNAEKEKAEAAGMKAQQEEQQRLVAEAARAAAEKTGAEALAAKEAAERERLAADAAKRQADEARRAAEIQQQKLAAEADRAKQNADEADRLRQQADQQRLQADQLRMQAEQQRQQAEQQQAALRQQLLAQFNEILQTRDTARGLIVNMSDVLFDTGRYTLKPGAREKLARVSGIILSHPGLKIEVEGHTDSVGGDDYNMKLSENRANGVRSFLASQGINPDKVTAKGFGKTMPVADNATATGRQMNRRVELVVSGDILGNPITTTRTTLGTTTIVSRP
jgi:outer membrane protein OmpA-like peptidoglycan-associated protein